MGLIHQDATTILYVLGLKKKNKQKTHELKITRIARRNRQIDKASQRFEHFSLSVTS